MPEFKIESTIIGVGGSKKKTRVEYESDNTTETFWKSHMFKDAILELISSSDFSKWDDDESELSSNEFFKLIMTELAERWYWEDPVAPDSTTVKEQLIQMIDYLELDKVVLTLDDDEED